MKTIRLSILLFVAAALLSIPASALAAASAPSNPMHPVFKPLDAAGQPALQTGKPVDAGKTCGACHDADYIVAHDMHRNEKVKATCLECHFADGTMTLDAGALDEAGFLKRERVLIHEPTAGNCGRCHGVVSDTMAPVTLPDGFESPAPADRPYRHYLYTQFGGAIFSPQKISESFLNIAGKESLDYPWDAHAAKVLACTSCHFAPNNPVRAASKKDAPLYLAQDPRRLSIADYLRAPDHRLATSNCRSCHDPAKVHDFLPYKARHLQELQCTSCHAPRQFAPVVQAVDRTVVRIDGGPRYEYRNFDREDGAPLDASFLTGYSPPLFPVRDAVGRTTIAPRNLVTTWTWVSGPKKEAVPDETVRQAYLDGDRYRTDVLAVFDADHDGRISDRELRLDAKAKVDFVRAHLSALGVSDPEITGTVDAWPVSHGVMSGKFLSRDCANCHGTNSRLETKVTLASFSPGGVHPVLATTRTGDAVVQGAVASGKNGDLVFTRAPDSKSFYVLGLTNLERVKWAGRSVFILVLFTVFVHGGLRVLSSRKHRAPHAAFKKVYMYSVYERLWHWFMALGVLALLATGYEIHVAGRFTLLGMPLAVAMHNLFAVLLMLNAFLALFYHLASAAIRQFIPTAENLRSELLSQIVFYLRGIFMGEPHPLEKTPDRKLNPLQQVTYLALLNVLFPLQIVTGILIWGVSRWPAIADALGGLTVVAPLHLLGSWLFLSFLVLHLYLTTTGRTVLSNIKAMIDGYDLMDAPKTGADHLKE